MMLESLSLTTLTDAAGFSAQVGDIRQSLLSLGLLIIVAKLAEGAFRRLHLNSILAYASAGILLGPVLQALTGWYELVISTDSLEITTADRIEVEDAETPKYLRLKNGDFQLP